MQVVKTWVLLHLPGEETPLAIGNGRDMTDDQIMALVDKARVKVEDVKGWRIEVKTASYDDGLPPVADPPSNDKPVITESSVFYENDKK